MTILQTMRTPIPVITVIALAACGGSGKPSSPPAPQIRATPVGSVDTTKPGTRDAFRRANQAAATVDTIIVHPDSLTLHVGQVLDLWTAVTIEARNSAGERVAGFAPLTEVRDQTIAELGSAGLTGRREGRTEAIFSPISLDPTVAVRPVRAVVVINVLP